MPRKPNPPPAIFRIEGMSDGIDRRLVDDFTGEVIPQPIKPVANPKIAIDAAKHKVRADKRMLLEKLLPQALDIVDVPAAPKAIAPHIPGKRAIVKGSIAIHVVLPPWRRDKF